MSSEPIFNTEIKSKKILNLAKDIQNEVKKIHWTPLSDLRSYTKIILIVTFLLGMGIYANDLFIGTVLKSIHFVIKMMSN